MQSELGVLGMLRDQSGLHRSVPSPMGVCDVGPFSVMLMSGAQVRAHRAPFGHQHAAFQARLRVVGSSRRTVAESTELTRAKKLAETSKHLSDRDRRTAEVLIAASRAYSGQPLMTGLQHRDFAWWNMGFLSDGRLYVFDWERASFDAAATLDTFHYFCMPLLIAGVGTARVWRAAQEAWAACPSDAVASVECAMILYLMDLLHLHAAARNDSSLGGGVLRVIHNFVVESWISPGSAFPLGRTK